MFDGGDGLPGRERLSGYVEDAGREAGQGEGPDTGGAVGTDTAGDVGTDTGGSLGTGTGGLVGTPTAGGLATGREPGEPRPWASAIDTAPATIIAVTRTVDPGMTLL